MEDVVKFFADFINQAWAQLSWYGAVALFANIVALIFSKKIFSSLVQSDGNSSSLKGLYLFRSINVVALGFIVSYKFTASAGHDPTFRKALGAFILIYVAVLFHLIVAYFLRRTLGDQVKDGDLLYYEDTPKTRNLRLIFGTIIFAVSLISVINIFEFNSLLEAGGVLGFLGFILFLVQPWILNDLVSGFVLSGYVSEKDVVELNDKGISGAAMIWKMKLLYTELIDLQNNHRIVLGNHLLRGMKVHNLSKNMPSSGLREKLSFKIGYEESVEMIKAMFDRAHQKALKDQIGLTEHMPLEIRVLDTGDHAVEWGVYYYIKNVKRILAIKQHLKEIILMESIDSGISLATPITHKSTS